VSIKRKRFDPFSKHTHGDRKWEGWGMVLNLGVVQATGAMGTFKETCK
jgi:hypothetical protein